jgi:hypothetical protein
VIIDYVSAVEGDYVGDGNLIGPAAFGRFFDVLAGDVLCEGDGCVNKIVLAAASAFAVIAIFDVPDRSMRDSASGVLLGLTEP